MSTNRNRSRPALVVVRPRVNESASPYSIQASHRVENFVLQSRSRSH